MISLDSVESLLERLYLGGGAPRREDRKKAREVADLLAVIARVQPQPAPRGRARVLVDAAAGNGYVGLCAAALLGWRKVVAIERDPDRGDRVRAAAARLDVAIDLRVEVMELDEQSAMPPEPDLLVALHSCGGATDGVLSAGRRAHARWILCAPCCYGDKIATWADAVAEAGRIGFPEDAILRVRFASARVDAGRLCALRSAGYEASLRAFTAPTVTPHHVLFHARRGGGAAGAVPSSRTSPGHKQS